MRLAALRELAAVVLAASAALAAAGAAAAPAAGGRGGSARTTATATAGGPLSCSVTHQKEDCGYLGIQQAECEARGCCWRPLPGGLQATAGVPWCYAPQPAGGSTYFVAQRSDDGARSTLLLELGQPVLPSLGEDLCRLAVEAAAETPQRLRLRIAPAGEARWEVPEWLMPRPGLQPFDPSEALYDLALPQPGEPFSFHVARSGAGASRRQAVFNTSGFSLVFKRQYMELTTQLAPSLSVYGLGETINQGGQLRVPRGRVVTLWTYDIAATAPDTNLYGAHPFWMGVDPGGLSFGVFLLNSNGMDVVVGEDALTYRVIGGVLDLYLFLGPGPEDVAAQYHAVAGRPAMPPLWSLGFHQSRWGYRDVGDLREVVAQYRQAGIPLDVVWSDIDYMSSYRDFTFDDQRFNAQQMREFVESLASSGQRWVPILDCGIPHAPGDPAFDSGWAAGVFIRDGVGGEPYLGQVWPGATHWPDFLAVNVTWPWWQSLIRGMWERVPFAGIWIDMNEASNFCDGAVCRLRGAAGAAEAAEAAGAAAGAAAEDLTHAGGTAAGAKWAAASNAWRALHRALAALAPRAAARDASQQQGLRQRRQEEELQARRPPGRGQPAASASEANCELDCVQPPPGDPLAHPPYAINNVNARAPLGSKALPVGAVHADGRTRQYDAHNLYGLSEAAATRSALEAITGRRPFVLTRSTFAGSGAHAAHWGGDNTASWDNLLFSVAALLNANVWGIPLAGSDVCGFMGDTTEELCARWIQAGSFYTFVRNHNTINARPQELYRWPLTAAAARASLGLRYALLPHLYTAHYRAHVSGGTVARPLFFEFPDDEEARGVHTQWLLGTSVMVAPALSQGASSVRAHLPAASWYLLDQAASGGGHLRGPATVELGAPLDGVPPVLLRGGRVLPIAALDQQGGAGAGGNATTAAVQRAAVRLVVALDQPPPGGQGRRQRQQRQQGRPGGPGGAAEVQAARGELFVDDGDSLRVPAPGSLLVSFASEARDFGRSGWLSSSPALPAGAGERPLPPPEVHEVVVLGVPPPPGGAGAGAGAYAVAVDGRELPPGHVAYCAARRRLAVAALGQPLAAEWRLEWRPAAGAAAAGARVVS